MIFSTFYLCKNAVLLNCSHQVALGIGIRNPVISVLSFPDRNVLNIFLCGWRYQLFCVSLSSLSYLRYVWLLWSCSFRKWELLSAVVHFILNSNFLSLSSIALSSLKSCEFVSGLTGDQHWGCTCHEYFILLFSVYYYLFNLCFYIVCIDYVFPFLQLLLDPPPHLPTYSFSVLSISLSKNLIKHKQNENKTSNKLQSEPKIPLKHKTSK